MQRLFLTMAILLGAAAFGPWAPAAQACPLCKEANETNPDLPRAYMYSILFMLAMPATVLTGFGIGFYRLSRKQKAEAEVVGDSLDDLSATRE
ncbi:MAG: hypothetical protein AB7O26_09800 [Planctomycetaceae bacterium]